jgi:hypothetical protein
MSDPFSVLSTTSSIISLLEFAWTLLAETRTIYKSAGGATEECVVLTAVANDIKFLNEAIIVSPSCGINLLKLVEESRIIADELLDAVDSLTVKGNNNAWKSFTVALKQVWKKGKLEEFSKRLSWIQGQVASNVQFMIL